MSVHVFWLWAIVSTPSTMHVRAENGSESGSPRNNVIEANGAIKHVKK